MATMNDWIKEAEEQAKRYSDTLKQNNQYLIDQLNQSKKNTLDQLQSQQNNAIYNLNTNKASINQTATDNAKQINVAKLMALKSNQEAMNRAGLGTQGVVGSQVNEINNEYGNNLTSILNQRTNDLRNLEKEKNNTLLTYNTNRLNLENEYGNNLANLQASINDKALNQYNTVYKNYLAMKQQEYDNQQAEIARQEAIRQYNENLALQKARQDEEIRQYNENLALQKAQLEHQRQQDAIANSQKWASINKTTNKNNVVDFTDGGESVENNTTNKNPNIITDYYNGQMTDSQVSAINKYGTFGSKDKNGVEYQPKGVIYNGTDYGKLTKAKHGNKTGMTVAEWTANDNFKNSSGVNVAKQNVWMTPNGQAWIWNGSKMTYEPIGGFQTRLAAK